VEDGIIFGRRTFRQDFTGNSKGGKMSKTRKLEKWKTIVCEKTCQRYLVCKTKCLAMTKVMDLMRSESVEFAKGCVPQKVNSYFAEGFNNAVDRMIENICKFEEGK
jgi:hypothetical protein